MPGTTPLRPAVLALLLLLATGSFALDTKASLKKLGRIHVGSMGEGDEGEHFRVMLGYELGRSGFKVVDFEQQADVVLTGLLSTRVQAGRPVVRATVFLKTRDGKTLWTGDFDDTADGKRRNEDTLRRRAEDVAKALKRATDQARTPSRR